MLALALIANALADDPAPAPTPPPATTTVEPAAPATVKERKNKMEVGARGKYLFLPAGLLDIVYYPHTDDGIPARPDVSAYAVGLEYVLDAGSANGVFYVEFIGSLTDAGYWDDKETPEDFTDGSWIQPENIGLVVVGANYMGEFPATDWFSFMVGGGLGVGIATGRIVQWTPNDAIHEVTDPDCGPGAPAYDRADSDGFGCADDGVVDIPPVLPMVDISIAAKFNINERASIRLEGGLHDLIYGGAAVGIRF